MKNKIMIAVTIPKDLAQKVDEVKNEYSRDSFCRMAIRLTVERVKKSSTNE
jgi:metal-responsive CopG/Arc/MetJ family transcriptional regulator